MVVAEEVYQATASDAKASGAVDSLVRHISMLQAAIRHLMSLLESAIEKSGGGLNWLFLHVTEPLLAPAPA